AEERGARPADPLGEGPGCQGTALRSGAGQGSPVRGWLRERLQDAPFAIPVVRAYMPNGRRAAEMIQADWAKIGVQAQIVSYEWGEYLKRVREGEAEVAMLGGTWDYPDP